MMRRAPSPEREKVQGPCFTAGSLRIDDRLFPVLCRGQMGELQSEWYQKVLIRDGLFFLSDYQHLLGMNTCQRMQTKNCLFRLYKNEERKKYIYNVPICISN